MTQEPAEGLLDAANRVLRVSSILQDMRTLGLGVAAFVNGAIEGGLDADSSLFLSETLIETLVAGAIHYENNNLNEDEDDD